MSTKSFTFNVPAVQLSDQDFIKINETIKKAQIKATANTLYSIDEKDINWHIEYFFKIENVGQRVSKMGN
jgi:hypothetical protein